MTSSTLEPRTGTVPTVVLVHGAFADSSSWNGVIARLRQMGYPVIAAANPLRALHDDAELLRDVLDGVDGPVVVAGHSYGGSVMSEAADGHRRVAALVYVASFLLDEGESTGELAGRFPGNELGPALRPVPVRRADGQTVDDLSIAQEEFPRVFAADVPADVAGLMAVTQRPIVGDALAEKATRAAWKTIPSWTLVTLQDLAVPAQAQRFMAERAGSHAVEVDASHAVTVSRPDVVARLIDEAARATAASCRGGSGACCRDVIPRCDVGLRSWTPARRGGGPRYGGGGSAVRDPWSRVVRRTRGAGPAGRRRAPVGPPSAGPERRACGTGAPGASAPSAERPSGGGRSPGR
jgi:pimeloyl-ACP methyl ester carboxylesterase